MRNKLSVVFDLDHIHCFDEADGWGSAEPYLWVVYFKIDGTTVKLNDSLMLEGHSTVFTTPGSHGNLNNTDVDAGDVVPIPSALGHLKMELTPIPVPDSVKALGVDDVTAIAGCIVILMEEDNVSDDGAEAGHQALNSAVKAALDGLIPTLGVTNQSITDADIKKMTDKIQSKIESAIENQQNFFENLWAAINPDDLIGTNVWKFSGDDLLSKNPIALQKRWTNDNGDWEIFGSINTKEEITCPADLVKKIFDALFGADSSKKSMKALQDFQKADMIKYKGLGTWWSLARKNAFFLAKALDNKAARDAAVALFRSAPEILSKRDAALSEEHFNNAMKVLNSMADAAVKDRLARKDVSRSIDALQVLKGKSPNQIFDALSTATPARYPNLKNLRLKATVRKKSTK